MKLCPLPPPSPENTLGETTPSTATQSAINQENGIALLSSTPAGKGTKESPYLISTAEELAWFRDQVNDGNNEICARLTADIKLGDGEWVPIGNKDNEQYSYKGTFDGSYYTISNINLMSHTENECTYRGLFGYIYGGTITKLSVKTSDFGANGDNKKLLYSGLLAAHNYGGNISLCSATITKILNVGPVGLLVYDNLGEIENCYAFLGETNTTSVSNASGLVYNNQGKITNCYFKSTSQAFTYTNNYAIAANQIGGTITNCYYYSTDTSTNKYKDDGANIVAKGRESLLSGELIWLLNNGQNSQTNNTSPWRHLNNVLPSLDPRNKHVTRNENGNTYTINTEKPHVHMDNGEPIEFTEISSLSEINANSLTKDTNYFCLKNDIVLDSTWEVPYTKNIVLCMNGHNITKGASFNADTAISTNETKDLRRKLTLTNCNNSVGGSISSFKATNDSAITHKGGYLTLSGNMKITDNTKNILLKDGHYIELRDLNENARFGISTATQDTLGADDSTIVTYDQTSAKYLSNLYADGYKDDGTGFDLFVNDQQYIRLRKQTPHKHCICGGAISNEGHSQHEADTTFMPWQQTDSLPATAGNYYLTRNVDLTTKWEPSGTVNLCLNGFSITTSDTNTNNRNYIDLDVNTDELTLTDCKEADKQGTISYKPDGSKLSRKAISLSGGATFNLYGGTIKDYINSAVYVTNGTFNMYGGTLTNNTTNTSGLAVKCDGSSNTDSPTFNMYGGKITDNHTDSNTGSSGGGVYIARKAAFTMTGGEITNNSAYLDGGGVCITNGASSYSISNATITGNTAAISGNGIGGGICASIGGTISNSTISNNQANSGGGIYSYGALTIKDSKICNNKAIIIDKTTETPIGDAYGGGILSDNSLTISNTTISGNTVSGENVNGRDGFGGGIYASNTTTFNDGTIIQNNTASTAAGGVYRSVSKPLSIAGKIKITENTASSATSNLYFSSSTIKNPIIVDSELDEQTSIGVTVNGVTADNIPLNIVTVDESAEDLNWLNKNYFTSDNSDYITLMSENNKFIQLGKHRHSWKYELSADYATVHMTCTDPECDSQDGGTLTIQEPTLKIYNGQNATGAEATLTEVNWKGATTADLAPTITYTNKQNGTNLGNTAPTNAGEYIASITVGTATASVNYTIEPKEVTVTGITAQDIFYNGTTNTTIDGTLAKIEGKLDPDEVDADYSNATATFADKNVGTDKTVTITGIILTGKDAANYKLAAPPTAKADISPRELFIKSVSIADKEYDGSDTATVENVVFTTNPVAGDDISLPLTARFENANAGEGKTIILSAGTLLGNDAGNYTFDNRTLPTDCKATIRKATPTGAPKYTAITESGKTISGAALTTEGGTFNVPGTVTWVDDNNNPLPDSTIVEAGKSYKWLFTPTDSNNYNTLSDSVELYHKQDSGSTGGGSTGGGSTGAGTQYTIEVIKGAHGSSSSGDISVSQGNDHTFTFTPNKGYTIFDVKIDGKSIGAVDTYTFENIDANHTIEVIFVKSPTHQIPIPIFGRFTEYYFQSMIHNLYRNIIFLHRISA